MAGFGLNLKLVLYLQSQCLTESLGFLNPPLLQAAKRCVQHIFRTYAESFSPIFPKGIYWNCYRKILRENWKPNRTLSINFVLKLRFRVNPLWNQYLKLNVAWKYALHDNPTFAEKLCVEFFKFRKYYAAHNSGLKIWLVSGIFEMAQLLNLKFCVYLCWLGAGFSPQFSSRETLGVMLRATVLNSTFWQKRTENIIKFVNLRNGKHCIRTSRNI